MPRTGATFNLLLNDNYPAVDGTVIDPEAHNASQEDMAQGLTDSVSRDGAGAMSGNLNLGSHKITNLAAGSGAGDSVRYEQVQLASAFATALEGAAWASGKMFFASGATSVTLFDTQAYGRSVLNAVDATALRTLAGFSTLTDYVTLTGAQSLSNKTLVSPTLSGSISGAPSWASAQTFNGVTSSVSGTPFTANNTSGGSSMILLQQSGVSRAIIGADATSLSIFDGSANSRMTVNLTTGAITAGGVAVPTISSTSTLTNKTITSPTLTGTVTESGNVTFSGARTFFQANNETFPLGVRGGAAYGEVYWGATLAAQADATIYNGGGVEIGRFMYTGGIRTRIATAITTTGTLVAADANTTGAMTAGITNPASVFVADDIITRRNNSGGALTLTQGAGMTQRLHGSATTGNLSVANRGVFAIQYISATESIVSGDVS